MALYNRAWETTTSPGGTGTINLAGAKTGYQTFVDAGAGGATVSYVIVKRDDTSIWEYGTGTITDAAPDTLSRTLRDSSTGSLLNLTNGDTYDVYCDAAAEDIQVPPSEGAFADGDKTKLDGIETAATADQTQADINALAITQVGTVTTGTWEATDVGVGHGGTGSSTAAGARTNLGVAIGTDVQAFDATLTSIAALGTAGDKLAYTTGVDTWAETALTSFARTLLDDTTAAAARTTLDVDQAGTDNSTVSKVGTPANNEIGVWTGDGTIEGDADLTWDESDLTIREAVNDGNPQVRIGATDAEELHIQAVYDTGAQTLDYVLLQTDVASATADKGKFRFNVDGTDILDIDDGGLELTGSITVSGTVDGRDVATDGTKLDGIETGATADQTQADINALAITETGTVTVGTWSSSFGDALIQDLADIAGTSTGADEFIVSTGVGTFALESGATARTSIGLGNVEDTALSTWTGSTALTTTGTVTTGTWSGSFGDALIQDLADIAGTSTGADQFIVSTGVGTFALESGATARTSIGLGNVENTALSTWAGSSNITTTGTVTSGTWSGSYGTGAHDFGGATSLEIPNSATPTVNADGEIAIDTTVTDFSAGVMKYYSTEEMAVVAMPVAQLTTPTDGHVVSYNATNDEFELAAAGGGGGFTIDTEQATTSGSSKDFTIASGATVICIMFDAVSATSANDIEVTLGDAGGIETTGYNGDAITDAFLVYNGTGTGDNVSGNATLTHMTGNTWCFSVSIHEADSAVLYQNAGRKTLSGELTTVRVQVSGGTFDAGATNVSVIT